MRRWLCLMLAVLLCGVLACPAYAATGTFVPSISYKDGPDVVKAEIDGKNATGCVVVTSIKEAEEKTTDIYQEDRDLLLKVYEELDNGSMALPLNNKDYVVRELVDVSFVKTGCVEVPHGHKEWLAEAETSIRVVFDLGIKKGVDLEVLAYVDGQWGHVKSVTNNGDGTVTCEFEDFCPVAFCVNPKASVEPPKTGDVAGENLMKWIVLMAVSFCAMVVMLINRRRIVR